MTPVFRLALVAKGRLSIAGARARIVDPGDRRGAGEDRGIGAERDGRRGLDTASATVPRTAPTVGRLKVRLSSVVPGAWTVMVKVLVADLLPARSVATHVTVVVANGNSPGGGVHDGMMLPETMSVVVAAYVTGAFDVPPTERGRLDHEVGGHGQLWRGRVDDADGEACRSDVAGSVGRAAGDRGRSEGEHRAGVPRACGRQRAVDRVVGAHAGVGDGRGRWDRLPRRCGSPARGRRGAWCRQLAVVAGVAWFLAMWRSCRAPC